MVEVEPAERPDAPVRPERPLLAAHPWRLPVLLALAFAATVAIAAAMLRGHPHEGPVPHASQRR